MYVGQGVLQAKMIRSTGFFVFVILQVVRCQINDVTVTTGAGTLIGFKEEVKLEDKDVTISKFLGIPYAEPPMGDLRFRKPVSKAPLKDPVKVQKFGSACLQNYFVLFLSSETDSEDCLYLNVFKPEIGTEVGEKMPVMVWVHGGAFVVGSSNAYIGDALAANGPVIVVTINYRLTAWGFLSTGDQHSPGNYGLWDQHLAIQWVHKNIEAFGGDPSRVTIFGESAGSASVIFQGLFPGNKGLFQRIIAQSGTAAGHWAITKNTNSDARKLATYVGCETKETGTMLDCLRKVPAEKINATINDHTKWQPSLPLHFVPSVDGDFVRDSPTQIFDANKVGWKDLKETLASFDLMVGLTSGEGGGSVQPYNGVDVKPENFLPNKTFFDEQLVPHLVKAIFGKDIKVLCNAVINEYTDWDAPNDPESIRQSYCMMHGDSLMLGNVHQTTKLHASMGIRPTYQYLFDLLPYKSILQRRPTWFKGSLHADDLLYTFGNQVDFAVPGILEKREFQDWEIRAADDIMTMWTNFAKTGNPNKPRDLGIGWLPYTPAHSYYLEIVNKVTSSKLKERLRERKARFWSEFLPALAKATQCDKDPSEGTCSRDSECPP